MGIPFLARVFLLMTVVISPVITTEPESPSCENETVFCIGIDLRNHSLHYGSVDENVGITTWPAGNSSHNWVISFRRFMSGKIVFTMKTNHSDYLFYFDKDKKSEVKIAKGNRDNIQEELQDHVRLGGTGVHSTIDMTTMPEISRLMKLEYGLTLTFEFFQAGRYNEPFTLTTKPLHLFERGAEEEEEEDPVPRPGDGNKVKVKGKNGNLGLFVGIGVAIVVAVIILSGAIYYASKRNGHATTGQTLRRDHSSASGSSHSDSFHSISESDDKH